MSMRHLDWLGTNDNASGCVRLSPLKRSERHLILKSSIRQTVIK